ncbi:TIR domain-containing protein [Fodinicurvata sp. EGI_FJ10296]|uniref:TIR domain-containing protein n=1 Tax=Fodinicurvata sp. EGI_FJ10296 TaxID=3231908 RepID=UPI003454988D
MEGLLSSAEATIQKRIVFFSFHYQKDIWRVNQVRNSWRYQHEQQRVAEGFFDGSIWESSQRKGSESLKSLIREGMKNTSVTCVLAGAETYDRRWVRYEIARSIVKGNGLLVVHIHNVKNQAGFTLQQGPNPLDYIGTYKTNDGRILLAEKKNGNWVRYEDYTQAVTLPSAWRKPTSKNVVALSSCARSYCYIANKGQQNFASWVRHAADKTGN